MLRRKGFVLSALKTILITSPLLASDDAGPPSRAPAQYRQPTYLSANDPLAESETWDETRPTGQPPVPSPGPQSSGHSTENHRRPQPVRQIPNLAAPGPYSLYSTQDTSRVFHDDAFRTPEFLPPEAYDGFPGEDLPESLDEFDFPLQFAQYPLDDSASDDLDPHGSPNDEFSSPGTSPSGPGLQIPQDAGPRWQWVDHSLTTTVLPSPNGDLGMTTVDLRTTIFPSRLPFLRFTPHFSWHFLSGPSTPDLPARLYDVSVSTTLYLPTLPIGDRWSFVGTIDPALFTDFENVSSDAVRITGRALFFYQWSETWRLSGGLVYLDRDDIAALPAVGATWTPSEDRRFELIFPKPKMAFRTACSSEFERWWYFAGEFGGNSWAIDRANGTPDVATISDLRLIVGIEQINHEASRWLLETGFVFNRKLEYSSGIGDTDQDPTAMLRAGIVF